MDIDREINILLRATADGLIVWNKSNPKNKVSPDKKYYECRISLAAEINLGNTYLADTKKLILTIESNSKEILFMRRYISSSYEALISTDCNRHPDLLTLLILAEDSATTDELGWQRVRAFANGEVTEDA